VTVLGFVLEYFHAGLADSVENGRACYSRMADELCELFMKAPGVAMNLHMECFQTMLNAPVADDRKSSYLQEAVSVFTEILCSDS